MSDYYKVTISISPNIQDAADLVAAFLADIGYESFEQNSAGLDAYVQDSLFNENSLEDALKDFPFNVQLNWTTEKIDHIDWNQEWEQKYFKPLLLADGKCVVHSSFHKDYPKAELDILIDPKMAFGTGHHATTTMMVACLYETELKGKRVIDMGTGTGILAIIASKLGASEVIGVEIDPGAYENALENVSLNGADVLLLQGDVRAIEGLHDVDIFLANINRNIILADIEDYVRTIIPGGHLFLSGFYVDDVKIIESALTTNGMEIASVEVTEDSWACIKAVKLQ